MAAPVDTRGGRVANWVAGLSALCFGLFVVYLSGGPHQSDDLWFHLAMGRAYAEGGLALGGDPLLHTGYARDPVAHEWLFDVVLHGLDRSVGLQGLRVIQALAVGLTLWLCFSISRRARASPALLALASSLFLVLSWWRFVQFRPDLVTIPALLGLYRLLLESGRVPSWRRVFAATVILVLWANAHSAFVIGPLFLLAALMGIGLRAALAVGLRSEAEAAAERAACIARARRVAAALAVGTSATFLNPRGWEQHLTYFSMSRGVLPALDDWLPFDFLSPAVFGGAFGWTGWIAMNSVGLAFVAAAVVGGRRWLATRSRHTLEGADPLHFGLAMGCLLAVAVAIRFTWTAFFPLLFTLRAAGLAAAAPSRWVLWCAALGSLALPTGLAIDGTIDRFTNWRPVAWAGMPYAAGKYYTQGVVFLKDSGVEGNLFNDYHTGGFLGYWLAPRLRTFIDGRNEAYPPRVFADWIAIQRRRGLPREPFLRALDRRRVDLFFGTGLPLGPKAGLPVDTTAHLERAPGWIPVFRNVNQAIYLRVLPRNGENLARIASYYQAEGVPFDRVRGFDAAAVVEARPDWALAHGLVPLDHALLLKATDHEALRTRLAALSRLAAVYALLGNYELQIALDRAALAQAPPLVAPRRRLVYGMLRSGRTPEAVEEARALVERDPDSARSASFLRVAEEVERLERRGAVRAGGALVDGLELLTESEANWLLAGRFAPAPVLSSAVADGLASSPRRGPEG